MPDSNLPDLNEIPECPGDGPHDSGGLYHPNPDGPRYYPHAYGCQACIEAAGSQVGAPAVLGGRDVNYENP